MFKYLNNLSGTANSTSTPTANAAVVSTELCPELQLAAAAVAVADVKAQIGEITWPVIINLSLTVVDNHYIDGWVVKGTDIVVPALFEGHPNSISIDLVDAVGAKVPCKAEKITYRSEFT